MQNSSEDKKITFYYRARKQYQNAQKPFTYELNIRSTQNRPKKFLILINKFIQIFKSGMKQEYLEQSEEGNNYWDQLMKSFNGTYEMDFIKDAIYDKKIMKVRQYFGILIYTKKIFSTLQQIIDKIPHLYKTVQEKKKLYSQEIKLVDFLNDGQYTIMGDLVNQFETYTSQRKQKQVLEQKRNEIEKERKRKEKQAYQRQMQDLKRREQQMRQKQQHDEEMRKKLLEELSKNKQQYEIDMPFVEAPEQYRRRTSTHQELKYQKSHKQLVVENKNNQKNYKVKHSQQLYQQRYAPEHDVFSFKLKPETSINKQKCYDCGNGLSQGLYFFGGNQNLCYYTGEWHCNQCISDQRISIPWKALQNFDLRGYPVSKKSLIEIKSYYEKPIIQIENHDPVVQNNPKIYQFLVIRRQIHLMYDAICNLELIQMLLKKKLNYCLKINLFSLKNLYDIYNGQQINTLVRYYEVLSRHFSKCQTCLKKKGYTCPKCKDPVKIFPFQIRETIGCKNCHKLFHRKCLNGPCECSKQ